MTETDTAQRFAEIAERINQCDFSPAATLACALDRQWLHAALTARNAEITRQAEWIAELEGEVKRLTESALLATKRSLEARDAIGPGARYSSRPLSLEINERIVELKSDAAEGRKLMRVITGLGAGITYAALEDAIAWANKEPSK